MNTNHKNESWQADDALLIIGLVIVLIAVLSGCIPIGMH